MRTGAALAVAVAMILVGGGSASAVRLSGPILTPPGSLAEPATTPCGSSLCGVVDYGFSVTGGTPPYTLSCNYPSGGLFPIGTYPVTCTATDATGATSAPASFMLTIGAPPTPPPSLTITPPANMSVQASLPCPTNTSLACGVITYTYGITGGAPPYNLICNVPSGSIEPVGSYVIRCMGQDREDDSTPYQTFDVTITPPTTPFVDAPPGYVPDVTGCANSSCMASSLTGADFDGASCDLASTTCTVTTASPVTLHAWNQTGDVKVAITANGQPVSIAATTFTEQQSGITYTSAPITPQPGTNVITATVDDPLGRLPAAVYTWTIEYTAPTSSSTGGAGNSSSGGRAAAAAAAHLRAGARQAAARAVRLQAPHPAAARRRSRRRSSPVPPCPPRRSRREPRGRRSPSR